MADERFLPGKSPTSFSANFREDTMNIGPVDVFKRLRRSWHRSMSRRRAINELAACPPNELRRIASDLGLSGNDLRQFCRSDHGATELMPLRLQLLGLDPEFVRRDEPILFRDLARVCASCQSSRRCARDLANGEVQAGMSTYCLNGPSIDHLTVGPNKSRHALEQEDRDALVDDTPRRASSNSHV
jgi:hypothetical protein